MTHETTSPAMALGVITRFGPTRSIQGGPIGRSTLVENAGLPPAFLTSLGHGVPVLEGCPMSKVDSSVADTRLSPGQRHGWVQRALRFAPPPDPTGICTAKHAGRADRHPHTITTR